jgi:hypothetical protein
LEKRGKDEYWTLGKLRTLGWTDALIGRFLGPPDSTRRHPLFTTRPPMQLYLKERVEACRKKRAFKAAEAETRAKQASAAKGTATRAARLRDYVEQVQIDVPVLECGELIRRAYAFYTSRKWEREWCEGQEFNAASPDADQGFLDRITVNYLRHRLNHHEVELALTNIRVGMSEARRALNTKMFAAIVAAYPRLADECRRQQEGRVVI